MKRLLGVIGGTGLYDMPGLEGVETVTLETPFGPPSDALVRARVAGTEHEVVFLPRHGRGHRIAPHAINYRANLCALKLAGVTHVLSISAVGSMREHIAPGDVVVVDQFIDWTRRRVSTFFEEGIVAHVAFSEPICPVLAEALLGAAQRARADSGDPGWGQVHRGGTYLCIDGPQFSTRAESLLYRSWDAVDLIGMTNMPEAKLAREAELPYATLALATDYDCWHTSEEAVDVEAVLARLAGLVERAKQVIARLAVALPDPAESPAYHALRGAVVTQPALVPAATRERLAWLLPELRQ